MAWLDKLLYKQHTVHRCCATGGGKGGQDQAQDGAEERQTLEKSRPCIDTDVLAKARCSEDKKHAGDKKETLVKTVSILIIILHRFSHMSDKLWFTLLDFTALLKLNCRV